MEPTLITINQGRVCNIMEIALLDKITCNINSLPISDLDKLMILYFDFRERDMMWEMEIKARYINADNLISPM
jgi:hypothetical protein